MLFSATNIQMISEHFSLLLQYIEYTHLYMSTMGRLKTTQEQRTINGVYHNIIFDDIILETERLMFLLVYGVPSSVNMQIDL